MKRGILFLVLVFAVLLSNATTPIELFSNKENKPKDMPSIHYQQFKQQVINLNTYENKSLLATQVNKDDYLMLYVAGGLTVGTVVLAATVNTDNFPSNSPTEIRLGIIAGGLIIDALILTKYFIEK